MANKRLKISITEYNSLIESRDWCLRKGWTGLTEWYAEKLAFEGRRRALPDGVPEGMVEEERGYRRDR